MTTTQFCHSEEVGAATDEESALGVNEKQIPLPRQRDRNDRLARWEAEGEPFRWPKGVSGNPGGRPKVAALSQACREKLSEPVPKDRTYAQAIADTLASRALKGDVRAFEALADRAEGRARQVIEIEHRELRVAFRRMTREEMLTYATTGTLPPWFPREEETNP